MALFVSSIGLKQASGGKIPLFYSSFFLYSEPNFSALMLLWQAQSYFSSANLAFPVTFTTQTFDAISLHVYFPSLEQSRHRNSVLKISFFFPFFPTSYLKLDTALRGHLYTMFDNVRPHRLLSLYVYLLNGHYCIHSNKYCLYRRKGSGTSSNTRTTIYFLKILFIS